MAFFKNILLLVCFAPFFLVAQTECNLTNYSSAYCLNANDYPYFSAGSGITVSVVLVGINTYNNFNYTCNGQTFSTVSPAWGMTAAAPAQSITLNFSTPVSSFSIIVNGTNATEEFYFSAATGTVVVSNFCTVGWVAINGNTGVRYNNAAAAGNLITVNNAIGSTSFTMTHSGTGAGSRYALLDCIVPAGVLPITLVDFNVNCDKQNAKLSWKTATELNNDYFTIERSIDGFIYEELETIDGAGNSNNLITYSWIDNSPLFETAYYRLKQTDFNGNFSYSEVIMGDCASNNNVNIFPNPFENNFTIRLSDQIKFPLHVKVRDYLGRSVHEQTISNKTQLIKVTLGDKISSGVYFVKVFNESEQFIKKIMK